jgi:voltage-gated potassium channel
MSEPDIADTQRRWTRIAEWPLTAAALLFLVAYAWQVIGQLTGTWQAVTDAVLNITWAIFAIDYLVNLTLARPRWQWFRRHLLDLLIVVLPILRPLRLIRVVTVLQVLQRNTGRIIRGRVIAFTAIASALLIFTAAVAVLDAERGEGGSIQTFGDALWWAFVTVTTVGYGDFLPVTFTGRFIAVGLMIGGIALIGVVTATLASWIVERVSDARTAEKAEAREEYAELRREIHQLRALLERANGESTTPVVKEG